MAAGFDLTPPPKNAMPNAHMVTLVWLARHFIFSQSVLTHSHLQEKMRCHQWGYQGWHFNRG